MSHSSRMVDHARAVSIIESTLVTVPAAAHLFHSSFQSRIDCLHCAVWLQTVAWQYAALLPVASPFAASPVHAVPLTWYGATVPEHCCHLGSRMCGKNIVSVGTSRSGPPTKLQYEPRIHTVQHDYYVCH